MAADVSMALRSRGWSPYALRLDPEQHAWIALVIDWRRAADFPAVEEPIPGAYFADTNSCFPPLRNAASIKQDDLHPGNPGPKPIFHALGSKDPSRLFDNREIL